MPKPEVPVEPSQPPPVQELAPIPEVPAAPVTEPEAAPAPKLKLKLSEKSTAALAPGMSFLGAYDRELDSDDEDLTFEEQFVLRMPPGEDLEKLRNMVQGREVSNDVWFKFKGTVDFPRNCIDSKAY